MRGVALGLMDLRRTIIWNGGSRGVRSGAVGSHDYIQEYYQIPCTLFVFIENSTDQRCSEASEGSDLVVDHLNERRKFQ